MAKSDKTISIGFKVEDGADGLKNLIVNAEDLRKVLRANVEQSKELKSHLVNFASLATGIDSLSSAVNSALGFVDDMARAYDIQAEAETRLEKVMRNTMDATDEQIQSIKDFCSAQQAIGVVGDEVQLAGAQELATYLTLKSSLQSLIPVMNDMLVQQNGLSSTGENAAQIATMLGKVMEGQTGALSRYGYKFDEAQEKILKYGTEAEKVAVLVDVVEESVGGMNEAMAKTPAGHMQQIVNTLGDMKEEIGGLVKGAQPILTIGANATIALGGVMKLVQGLKALNVSLKLTRGASGWLGLALTAVTTVAIWFLNHTGEAADSLDRLTNAQERAARASEMAKEVTESEDDARKSATASIELNIAKLKNFNGTKAEEKKLVKEMNSTYGETMGYFKSVSEWYQALVKNSKAYCDQMVAEAKARKYADQIAELEIKRDNIVYDEKGNKKKYSTRREQRYRRISDEEAKDLRAKGERVDGRHVLGKYINEAWMDVAGTSDVEKAQSAYDDYTEQIKHLKNLTEKSVSKVEMPVIGGSKEPEPNDKQEKTRLQEINKQLAQYQEQYVKSSDVQKEQIRVKVAALTKEKESIELAQAELERPVRLDSLDAFDKELAYQGKLRKTATAEQISGIDETIERIQRERAAFELSGQTELRTIGDYEKEIARLQDLRRTATSEQLTQIEQTIAATESERDVFLRSSKVRLSADKIESYRELEEQIQLCNEALRYGTEEEKRWATENLPLFQDKERAISSAIAAIGVAERPEDAGNLEEIGAAISLLDDKIQRASADEVEALTRTKMAFEKKKEAYERGIRIPEMQKEVEDLQKLPERVLKVKVDSMGFEGLSEKLREIQKQLDDLDNPPTAGQRKALEELKSVYEQWRSECALSFLTLQNGWSNIKSIGNGFESLTSAVQDSSNAWQMITGVVDGFIQISNGIMAVLEIMEMIGIISKANAAAKTAEAVATTVSTTATAADAVATDAAVVAKTPAIAANKALTASYLELAASEYMAAHAYIPFAGFGIASGFTTAATTMVKSIGATAFADGGVVYGPTLGLVGEYAGASSNPEVIAPLNKLKDIIGTTPGSAPVIVGGRLEISGRKLAVVLENQSKIAGISGKKYTI